MEVFQLLDFLLEATQPGLEGLFIVLKLREFKFLLIKLALVLIFITLYLIHLSLKLNNLITVLGPTLIYFMLMVLFFCH